MQSSLSLFNLQNDFLTKAREEQKCVEVYLVSGIRLIGSIASFDQFVVMLRGPDGMQVVYKHAISTIQEPTDVRRLRSGAPREGRMKFGSKLTDGFTVARGRRAAGADGGNE
jgi:host factor-I protein